ncbi:MAG TPA: hypothetical protein PLF78_08540 [Caulobacter sp.]|nr:hypothetical protein [Caulobacter sp.]
MDPAPVLPGPGESGWRRLVVMAQFGLALAASLAQIAVLVAR